MTIVAAAIKFGDLVCWLPAPARHHDILRAVKRVFHGRTDEGFRLEVQGFMTDDGRFLGREEAYSHAHNCKQLLERKPGQYNGIELFSEDVW
jgi:hypothetical protein